MSGCPQFCNRITVKPLRIVFQRSNHYFQRQQNNTHVMLHLGEAATHNEYLSNLLLHERLSVNFFFRPIKFLKNFTSTSYASYTLLPQSNVHACRPRSRPASAAAGWRHTLVTVTMVTVFAPKFDVTINAVAFILIIVRKQQQRKRRLECFKIA